MSDRPIFNPTEAWRRIPADLQAKLGVAALELVLCWNACGDAESHVEERPYRAAEDLCTAVIDEIVGTHVPEIVLAEVYPLPFITGPICRKCGCTHGDACLDKRGDGCAWIEPDLCSACLHRTFAEPLALDTRIISIDGEQDQDDDDTVRQTGPNAVGKVNGISKDPSVGGFTYSVVFDRLGHPGEIVWVHIDSHELQNPAKYDVEARITIRAVQEAVAFDYGLDMAALLGPSRRRSSTVPRQVAMFLAAELTGKESTVIGRAFNRDRTTIVHAIDLVGTAITADGGLALRVKGLRERLQAGSAAQ